MSELSELFAKLSRWPDVDAPELQAYDATDELLITTARDFFADNVPVADDQLLADEQLLAREQFVADGQLVIVGDRHGALTLGAAALFATKGIRVHQDGLLSERALTANAQTLGLEDTYVSLPLTAELFTGAKRVLLQLPKSLAALNDIAQMIAHYAHPEVVVFAGGRVKHMSRSMNEVLGRSFEKVTAGLAWRKSRVLTAHIVKQGAAKHEGADTEFPAVAWGSDLELPFQLAAFGATFGGPTLDHGSRLLLQTLRENPPNAPRHIIDLGCGNGVLATWSALNWPVAEVVATDQSYAAVNATQLTTDQAGVAERVRVVRADACEEIPEGWADLIVLNPPFHSGSTVHAGVAHRLIQSAASALSPSGELRIVYNSHLNYRVFVERTIGPVRELARNRTFTVIAASKNTSR